MRLIGVIGSRTFPQYAHVDSLLAGLPGDALVVTGSHRGVDRYTAAACEKMGRQLLQMSPSNGTLLARLVQELVVFDDGKADGIRIAIREANRRGIPVRTVGPSGGDYPPTQR